jgi:hypothetical protein
VITNGSPGFVGAAPDGGGIYNAGGTVNITNSATKHIIADFPAARVLIFTQYNDEELKEAARDAGARGFVLKDDLLGLRSFLKEH